jgi:asparagine synthase (glutamine-hydrolysing)
MCGIAGIWTKVARRDVNALADCLDEALKHRGPDGSGRALLDDGRLLLVHRRLAIIDRSAAASQPMTSPDGQHVLAFNGEVYNHVALRRRLETAGETFRTASDTEVLLRLLIREGVAALADVRGMFALAWWDGVNRSLTLARDRFGIKPCYFWTDGHDVAFASELQALRRAGVARATDPLGVLGFLRWGSVPPPSTWLSGVTAIEPGTSVRIHQGRQESQTFADPRHAWCGTRTMDRDDVIRRTRQALADSVQAHLVADVPVGVFLSGGIDSGAIVAIASTLGSRLRTFTVVFDEATHDEADYAACVAKSHRAQHETLKVDATAVVDQLPAMLHRLDQPTIDGVNTYLIAGAVAGTGIKAVLSGAGGDEMFGGYPSFRRIPRGAALNRVPQFARSAAAHVTRRAGRDWRLAKLAHAAEHADAPLELYRAVRGWMMPCEIRALAGPALHDHHVWERADEMEHARAAPVGVESPHAAVSRLETIFYLRQQLLRDADVMSMAHGLELRVPFVDHVLLNTVWPAAGRYPELVTRKRLLVEASPPLPATVTQRRKQGFTLPFEHWLDGPLAPFVSDGLTALVRDGWITPRASQEVATAWKLRRVHWSRPWGLAVLGHFLAYQA